MRRKNVSTALTVALAMFVVAVLMTGTHAAAQQEKVLHSFDSGKDGAVPFSGLVIDATGNFYGTTADGGSNLACSGCGTVFQLSPQIGGGWTEKILFSFSGNNGKSPFASLILDASGNLYGTTAIGGNSGKGCGGGYEGQGCGAVFELSPQAGGGWTEKVLYSFKDNGTDGYDPMASLILDAAGNLFGTTSSGGANQYYGTVFELTPSASGAWTETVLRSFTFNGMDGNGPLNPLIFDAAGNLYGTTGFGGNGGGAVFELTHKAGKIWTEKTLYSFSGGTDGSTPNALIFDASGNLYGTTYLGGLYGGGTVFEMKPEAGGRWAVKVLYSFPNPGTDGYKPYGGLALDAGVLYGTTNLGGAYGYGTAFELKPLTGGGWAYKVLHSFGSGQDGQSPYAGLVVDAAGNLYGTTAHGGANNVYGTVFEVIP